MDSAGPVVELRDLVKVVTAVVSMVELTGEVVVGFSAKEAVENNKRENIQFPSLAKNLL